MIAENNDKDQGVEKSNKEQEHTIPVHNPFDPNDKRKISEEELENEQKFKEALTERD
jgi:hypothetical protein